MIRSINKNQSLGKSELYSETLKKKKLQSFCACTVCYCTTYYCIFIVKTINVEIQLKFEKIIRNIDTYLRC